MTTIKKTVTATRLERVEVEVTLPVFLAEGSEYLGEQWYFWAVFTRVGADKTMAIRFSAHSIFDCEVEVEVERTDDVGLLQAAEATRVISEADFEKAVAVARQILDGNIVDLQAALPGSW